MNAVTKSRIDRCGRLAKMVGLAVTRSSSCRFVVHVAFMEIRDDNILLKDGLFSAKNWLEVEAYLLGYIEGMNMRKIEESMK